MSGLTAGAPLEPALLAVGRRTVRFVDAARDQRALTADIWYPAAHESAERSQYELFPGVSFAAATAQHEPPVLPGRYPLVLLSHGRTGMRISYSMLCEALADRGAVVVSADHPGDALLDWLLGQQADDRTNEVNRVADAHFLLAALLGPQHHLMPGEVCAVIDAERVVLAGHSYGAYTAFAATAGSRGVGALPVVKAVIGLQAYTRSMSDGLLGRITVPSLLVVSQADQVTPPHVDAERPWALLRGTPSWRLDLAGAGHQAISDIALYAELAPQVPGLPELVRDYLRSAATGSQSAGARGWRELLLLQLQAVWAFLQVALGLDAAAGLATVEQLEHTGGITLSRR